MLRSDTRKLADLLDAHAHAVIHGQADPADLLASAPELTEAARPLMALARALSGLWTPVQPRPEFRAQLRYGLIRAAQHKQALAALDSRPALLRRPWIMGAAALGSAVSVIGVIAFLLHARHNARAQQTA